MTSPQPPLDDSTLARLDRLTRAYADLAAGLAGGSALLGGTFLLLLGWVEAAGHAWRLTWVGALAPLPLWASLVSCLVPLAWVGARWGLRRSLASRYGWVDPLRKREGGSSLKERVQRIVGCYVFPGLFGLMAVVMLRSGLTWKPLRGGLVLLLAAGLHWGFPYLKGRAERVTCLLLCIAVALSLSGIQMAATDSLLAYPLIGTFMLVLGARDLRAFRRVARELEALGGVA